MLQWVLNAVEGPKKDSYQEQVSDRVSKTLESRFLALQ